MPDVEIIDLEPAWHMWTRLEATGWRWPPSVLLEQPEPLFSDVLAIAATAQRVKEQKAGK